VAEWLLERRAVAFGRSPRWHAVEVGGGDGSLAAAVLAALPLTARAGLVLHAVERSEPAVAALRARLGRRVRVEPSVAAALAAAGGRALVFSNELVDAFPVDLLERRGGTWREVRLVRHGSRLVESVGEPPPWLDRAVFSVARLERAPEGARAEVHQAYRRWLRAWAPSLRRGAVLTIDYGDEHDALYGRGGGGTLRAYYANQRLDERADLYTRLGLQDLTCDVNFTDLRLWGDELGWRAAATWTQRELLARFGALRAETPGSTMEFVARPGGAGTAFRALWQQVG
jgi:SAM-dependent MidA family methyltransferase